MILQWLGILGAIIVVDLALSGDNALVIGAVASRLKGAQRRQAILFGGLLAAALRIVLAEAAVFVLRVPYIQAIGGVLVLYIAVQMISGRPEADDTAPDDPKPVRRLRFLRFLKSDGFVAASITILFADVSMSLDNVLSVAALARGDYILLLIGILFSMSLLLVASSVIAKLIERFPLLLYLAAGILAWTSGWMVANDMGLQTVIQQLDAAVPGPPLGMLIPAFFLMLALVAWLIVRGVQSLRHRKPRPGDV